ncbi:MAG: branched-chain amino acid transport system ATP-binding protein [Verrucomicrobiota bacterium]|jgi:branched-chain amino acid transport system ATP-binding protein
MQSNGTLLEARGLTAFYGDFQALFDIDFRIKRNETVAIIGSNGAGKSTLLKSIIGLVRAKAEAIYFDGKAIGGNPAYRIIAQGISMVPEGRRLFPSLSVEENLSIGAYSKRQGPWNLEAVYAVFPMLKEKHNVAATALSGGQQQMVAIGRALMANPRLLLCDEISLGLAPVIIKEIYAQLERITANGTTLIVVEQDIKQAMAVSDRVYCVREGRVVLEGRPPDLGREEITKAYFGM